MRSISPNRLKSSVLVGDFNINLQSDSPLSSDILATMLGFHLHQVVSDPTRVSLSNSNSIRSSSLIDHVYVSDLSNLVSCSTLPPVGKSDHLCISTVLSKQVRPHKPIRRRVWLYNKADWVRANDLLEDFSPDVSTSDPDTIWSSWKTYFLSVMDDCIPSKLLTIKKTLPWFNAEICRAIKKCDFYHRLYKSSFSEAIHNRYRSLRNSVVSTLRKAKFSYLNSTSTLIRSSKDFWSVYHSLTPNRERLPHSLTNGSVSAVSPKSKENLLNSYFSSCFNTPPLSVPSLGSSRSFHPTLSSIECTEEEVVDVLRSLKLKTSSGPDGISSSMLKKTLFFSISSTLCSLFNLSLSTGIVPSDWKSSNITPVFKSGNKNLVSNYRPISLLSIPSKLLERIVHNRLLAHLLTNSILSPRQFGFRPGSSTQEALLVATHD